MIELCWVKEPVHIWNSNEFTVWLLKPENHLRASKRKKIVKEGSTTCALFQGKFEPNYWNRGGIEPASAHAFKRSDACSAASFPYGSSDFRMFPFTLCRPLLTRVCSNCLHRIESLSHGGGRLNLRNREMKGGGSYCDTVWGCTLSLLAEHSYEFQVFSDKIVFLKWSSIWSGVPISHRSAKRYRLHNHMESFIFRTCFLKHILIY